MAENLSPGRRLGDRPSWAHLVAWQQQRGTKALRLPLLLLAIVGLPLVTYFLGGLHAGGLKVWGWLFTAGYALASALEVRDLRGAGRVTHGG